MFNTTKTTTEKNFECSFEVSYLDSFSLKIAVEIFYLVGGFLSIFGILLNFLCIIVVSQSSIFNKTCYGFYLKLICLTDIAKLIAEYQLRICIMQLHKFFNVNKNDYYPAPNRTDSAKFECQNFHLHIFLHCNLRLGFIMISENLSYMFSISLAADRCFRIWAPNWSKVKLTYKRVRNVMILLSVAILLYSHPHFYLIKKNIYLILPNSYLTSQLYSDCLVKENYYFSFNYYWLNVDSIVNSIVLPVLMVFFNVLLSLGVLFKTKNKNVKNCSHSKKSVRLKRRKKLARAAQEASLVVIIDSVLFMATIEPVNAFTYLFSADDLNFKMQMQIYGITVSFLNHSLNGLVYLICSKTFRDEFASCLGRFWRKGRRELVLSVLSSFSSNFSRRSMNLGEQKNADRNLKRKMSQQHNSELQQAKSQKYIKNFSSSCNLNESDNNKILALL